MSQLPPDRFSTAANFHVLMHRYAAALRHRWWIIAASILLIGGPSIIYALNKRPTFRSQAIMWLTSRLNLPGGGERVFSEEIASYMATQGELIKSPAIQFAALARISAAYPEIAALATNVAFDDLPIILTVKTSPKNSVLELEARGPSADATRAYLDAVMGEYLALKKSAYQEASSGALTGITDQLKEVENQIRQQQEAQTAFAFSNNISYLTEHGVSAGSHLAKLGTVLSDLRTEYRLLDSLTPEQFKDLSRASPNAISETPLPGEQAARALAQSTGSADAAYYQALQQAQLLKAKRDEFAKVLRPTHTKMIKLNQDIAGLDQLLKALKDEGAQQALAQMANRKKSLELQIQNLDAQYQAWETNAAEANLKLASFDRLKQDLQRSQALYDRLLGLLQTIDLNKNLDPEALSPLAPASEPQASSTRFKIAVAGLFLAFIVGFGLLLFLEIIDDRFTSASELSTHVPVEVVGQIPERRVGDRDGGRRLLDRPEDHHAFAESFRNLRASLLLMFEKAARPKIILLTSSVPKEGKSTIAANFASMLALAGSRVLLIDADLRRSYLHQILGVRSEPGLHEVLANALPSDAAIIPVAAFSPAAPHSSGRDPDASSGAVHPGNAISTFHFIPAGAGGSESSELLLGSRMDELLRGLAPKYDFIIIDTPPVLATNDVMSLASSADGVFMVVRAFYTSSRMLREALDRLHRCNVNILGLVYNRAAQSTDYYCRYSKDYHTKPGSSATPRYLPGRVPDAEGMSTDQS